MANDTISKITAAVEQDVLPNINDMMALLQLVSQQNPDAMVLLPLATHMLDKFGKDRTHPVRAKTANQIIESMSKGTTRKGGHGQHESRNTNARPWNQQRGPRHAR